MQRDPVPASLHVAASFSEEHEGHAWALGAHEQGRGGEGIGGQLSGGGATGKDCFQQLKGPYWYNVSLSMLTRLRVDGPILYIIGRGFSV